MIHIVGLATDPHHRNAKILQEKIGLSLLPFNMPFDWGGYCGTYVLSEYIQKLSDNDIVLITDVYDVLPLNGCNPFLLEKKIKEKFNLDKLIFGAETNCYPDGHLSSSYPQHNSPWKFLNGGGYFGTVKVLKYVIPKVLPLIKGSINQRIFTQFFLQNPEYITLDYTCEIFQTLFNVSLDNFIFLNNSIIVNKNFNTTPLLFHGNGKTNIEIFYQYVY